MPVRTRCVPQTSSDDAGQQIEQRLHLMTGKSAPLLLPDGARLESRAKPDDSNANYGTTTRV